MKRLLNLIVLFLVSAAWAQGDFGHIGGPGGVITESSPLIGIFSPQGYQLVGQGTCFQNFTQINGGPHVFEMNCADNDSSYMYSNFIPEAWDGGDLVFKLGFVQTAADTASINLDVACECRGAGDIIDNNWGNESPLDLASILGNSKQEYITSGAVTCNGGCQAGDTVYFYIAVDEFGTNAAMGTLHFTNMQVRYNKTITE